MPSSQLFGPVANDFTAINELIESSLHSRVPLVAEIAAYLVQAGGKRLRPLLVLLAARSCGDCSPHPIKLAVAIEFLHTAMLLHDDVVDESTLRRGRRTANAEWGNAASVLVGDFLHSRAFELMVELGNLMSAVAIEFLHTAMLLHDDVVDESTLRRGRRTANAEWGNAASVLVGDFLHSRAFELMVELGNIDVMALISKATNGIAEGEVQQLTLLQNTSTSEADYLEVIYRKTALLFEVSAESGAVLGGASASEAAAYREYGRHLGLAFQLMDDWLDYEGSAQDLGKNTGDDLAEGKVTLPIILALTSSWRVGPTNPRTGHYLSQDRLLLRMC